MSPKNKRNNHNMRKQNQPQQVASVSTQISQVWTSPLPPPEVINKYLEINPDLVSTITSQIQKESTHRQALETESLRQRGQEIDVQERLVRNNAAEKMVNTVLGFVLAFSLIGASFYLAINDRVWPAVAPFGTVIAYIFWGRISKDKSKS